MWARVLNRCTSIIKTGGKKRKKKDEMRMGDNTNDTVSKSMNAMTAGRSKGSACNELLATAKSLRCMTECYENSDFANTHWQPSDMSLAAAAVDI